MAREKPIPRNKRKLLNRGLIRSRNNDEVKNFSIGLMDIDSAIMFYFNNVIKPTVEENGEQIKVPIMYSNPQRWGMVQKRGYLIDNKKQIITPVIAFKRTSIEKDQNLAVDKLNPQDPKLFYTFQKQYNNRNRYDKFAVQQGLNQQKELYSVAVPDYITLQYEFIVWTTYIEQMNKIVEQIIYSEGSYWGEDGKFKFRTKIDNYTDASEVSVNTERLIKTNFTVTLNGYLIPEEFSKVVTTQKQLTPKRIIINDGIGIDVADLTGDRKDVRISVTQEPKSGVKPLEITAGTGMTITGGDTFDGTSPTNFTFNIGQPVETTSTVEFANVSASSTIHVGPTSFEISQRDDGKAQVNTDWVVLGDIIAESYVVSSSVTHMTTSFSSGSTIFGDTLDDTHQFTGSLTVTGSLNIAGGITEDGVTQAEKFTYLRKQFVKKATSITAPSTASFTAVTASSPSSMDATNEQDFVFFINGQYMEHDALTIAQQGSTFRLLIDNESIGYDLETDDEIIAMGKFNS
tara:strand:- start:261 stop:1808 length:1548 start_codon:yes stop_codon:yes gene_type:complete